MALQVEGGGGHTQPTSPSMAFAGKALVEANPCRPPPATRGFRLTIPTHGALKGFSRTETRGVGPIGKIQIDLSTNTTTVKPPCYVAHNGKIAWGGGARWGPKMPKCGILGKMRIKK